MSNEQHFFKPSVDNNICRRCNQPKNSIKHLTFPSKIKEFKWQEEKL